jgi:hypothetical protein
MKTDIDKYGLASLDNPGIKYQRGGIQKLKAMGIDDLMIFGNFDYHDYMKE